MSLNLDIEPQTYNPLPIRPRTIFDKVFRSPFRIIRLSSEDTQGALLVALAVIRHSCFNESMH